MPKKREEPPPTRGQMLAAIVGRFEGLSVQLGRSTHVTDITQRIQELLDLAGSDISPDNRKTLENLKLYFVTQQKGLAGFRAKLDAMKGEIWAIK